MAKQKINNNLQAEVLLVKPGGEIIASSREEPDGSGMDMPLPNAISKAMVIFAQAGQPLTLRLGAQLVLRGPEAQTVQEWLKGQNAEADALEVIAVLAWGVRSEWESLRRRTVVEHRELFGRIADLCSELTAALAATGSVYFRSGGHGLRSVRVADLMSPEERKDLTNSSSSSERTPGDPCQSAASLSIEDLLDRVADAARKLEAAGPLNRQPRKRGAENAYFVRRMGALLQQEYGEKPASVIAALASIALGASSDRHLVAKQLK